MKYVIASDIHGSSYYCELLKERFLGEGAEKLILLGDLLYHGARNPLPRAYDTLKCAAILNGLKERILCVRGNCDSQVDTLVLEFPVEADFAVLPIGKRTAILAHGHLTPAVLRRGDILINGHFHVPAFEERENCTYVNCGSVSIPKENSPHSYLVLENGVFLWKNVETGEPFLKKELTEFGGKENIL